jgi:hypothetical protein
MIKEIYMAHSQALCREKGHRTSQVCFARLTLLALENAGIILYLLTAQLDIILVNDQLDALFSIFEFITNLMHNFIYSIIQCHTECDDTRYCKYSIVLLKMSTAMLETC